METKFSIIVPIYGVEKYIKKCISSVLEQNYKNYELNLVDDGSPDSWPFVCDKYVEKDARNMGVQKATGD